MILLANTMSSTRNTLAVIFFLTCRPNLIFNTLFIFRTAVYHRLHTDHREKEHKDSDRMISTACAGTHLLNWFEVVLDAPALFVFFRNVFYGAFYVPAFHICGIHQIFPSSLTLLFLETLFYHQPKPECCSVVGSHLIF